MLFLGTDRDYRILFNLTEEVLGCFITLFHLHRMMLMCFSSNGKSRCLKQGHGDESDFLFVVPFKHVGIRVIWLILNEEALLVVMSLHAA